MKLFKPLLCLGIIVPFVFHNAVSQSADSSLFRYADLGIGTIELGQPFTFQSISIQESPEIYRQPMSYPGTSWIRVYSTPDNMVGGMLFWYNTGHDFDEAVESYSSNYGIPEFQEQDQVKIYTWQEGNTRFQLVQNVQQASPFAFSLLTDTELSPATSAPTPETVQHEKVDITIDDVLLSATQVFSVIATIPDVMNQRLSTNLPDVSPDTMQLAQSAVEQHFNASSLYGLMRNHANTYGDSTHKKRAIEWLFSSNSVRMRAESSPLSQEKTMEEYAQELVNNPPTTERSILIDRFIKANDAVDFYVLIEDLMRIAMNHVLAVIKGPDYQFPLLSDAEKGMAQQNLLQLTETSFLWMYDSLSDEELLSMVKFYESAPGQWFVDMYTSSLQVTFDEAGRRAGEALMN